MPFFPDNFFKPPALALLLCVCMPVSGAEERHEQTVSDLAYGSALYHLFQDQKLEALTDLTVAKQKGSLRQQPDDAELLLASLYFDYGLPDEAEMIFKQLLDENISGSSKNRVWFNLARVQYENNHYAQAEELLSRITESLSPQREAWKQHILTSLYIQNQQFEQAQKAASSIKPKHIWLGYSEYNLGIALMTAQNAQSGQEWLKKLAARKTDDNELRALQDSARLVLGLSSLRLNQLDEAIAYFSAIPVSGPLSNKALLATGWAWSRKSEPQKALTYWQALVDKDQPDGATEEAYLAIAYAYEQSGNKTLASQYYASAAERYEQQLRTMDEVIQGIKQMDLINTLHHDGIVQAGLGRAAENRPPDYLATGYIYPMIAGKPFQQAIQNYQELLDIISSLNRWKDNLPALELMLAERRNSFEHKRPVVEQNTDLAQLESLQQQRNALAAEVNRINNSEDFLALANENEADYLEQLNEIKTLLSRLEDQQDLTEEKQKYRLLQGLLYWDISTDFPRRYWKVLHQLQLLDRALEQATSSAASLQQASSLNELRLTDFDQRIDGQDSEIQRLEIKASGLIDQQEQLINRLAIQAIDTRKQQLVQLRLSARYSMARLYDEISAQRKAQ